MMLHRIFSNLLNNVVRHAEDKFSVAVDGHCVTFSNPIPPGANLDTDHLFDRSYRGDKSRFGEGAGLGLYIVKLLVEKQGGRVCAKLEKGEPVDERSESIGIRLDDNNLWSEATKVLPLETRKFVCEIEFAR